LEQVSLPTTLPWRCILSESFSSWAFTAAAERPRPSSAAIFAAGHFWAMVLSFSTSSAVQRRKLVIAVPPPVFHPEQHRPVPVLTVEQSGSRFQFNHRGQLRWHSAASSSIRSSDLTMRQSSSMPESRTALLLALGLAPGASFGSGVPEEHRHSAGQPASSSVF